ncbi:MAG: helix-turn-helix transcriptional regulator [Bacilli bacterium]|nr:helix-turn-helix transcriptional regulator [Bacilli bacterium]
MTLGEKIKQYRILNGLSQERLAELLNISRQAIAKWENNLTKPTPDNLYALADIFNISVKELLDGVKNNNPILESNLTLIAIVFQAASINIAIQPNFFEINSTGYYIVNILKIILILISSTWMALNMRYERNLDKRRRNSKIELLYSIIMALVALIGYYTKYIFIMGIVLVVICCIYVLVINPKYMNRIMYKSKKKDI